MRKHTLATNDPREALALIHGRFNDTDEASYPGLNAALALVPGRVRLDADDLQHWVTAILAYSAAAPACDVPGLTTALECLLALEDEPACELIDQQRNPVGRARRARRWLRRRWRRAWPLAHRR